MFPYPCTFFEDEQRCQPCDLVNEAARAEQKQEYEHTADASERAAFLAQCGINSWTHGFTNVPGISQVHPAEICPFDFMHCCAEGMAKHEFAAFFFAAIKLRKWFSYSDLRRAWDAYPWPRQHEGRIPFPTDTFLEGRKGAGKLPKKNIHFHWTAAQARPIPSNG